MDLDGVYISIRLGDKKEKNDSNENENKQQLVMLMLLVIPTTLKIVMAGIVARFKRQDNPHPHK